MRSVTLSRSPAPGLLVVSLALAACTVAAPSLAPASAPASEVPATRSPSPTPVPANPVATTPASAPVAGNDRLPVDPRSYAEMPVVFEMTRDCGLCGPEGWLLALPTFRLYADGLAVYRANGDSSSTAPYYFVRLDETASLELQRYALDEGGLRGADRRYRGDADDAGSVRFWLHAGAADQDTHVDVELEPILGNGTTDVNGDPIEDRARREQLTGLADLLSNFDAWVEGRGLVGTPYDPGWFTAAIVESFPGVGGEPWPFRDVVRDEFAPAGWGQALAKVTTEQAQEAGSGPGGASLPNVDMGNGRVGTLLIRPILPGDDRPGAFGLRPDMVAVTVEPGLRVRSRPEVSGASVMYEPLLAQDDALYVTSGPVEGSGYDWFEVHAPRTGHTGWVAAAAKTGEVWIVPAPLSCTLGASPDEIVDKVGYELMHLACYSGVEFGGTYRLAPYEAGEFELTCPDMDYIHEPGWLNSALSCAYDFGPEEASTGAYDLPAGGVLHPSLADVPSRLLESSPEGLLVDVTGQLDHPDTRGCTRYGVEPSLGRLMCRTTFVITELRPAD